MASGRVQLRLRSGAQEIRPWRVEVTVSAQIAVSPAANPTVVRPSPRQGIPLNAVMTAVGAFWFALALVAVAHGHALGAVLGLLLGFAFIATLVLYYKNASLWADADFVGKTDILGRRTACRRSELGSVDEVGRITRRVRFLRKDGRLGFEINLHAWRKAEVADFAESLGL